MDKTKVRIREKNNQARKRIFSQRVKTALGCKVCGYNKHYRVLDFHHVDPSTKNGGVSKLASSNCSMAVLKAEMRQCVILCANHHRELDAGIISVNSHFSY